MILSDSRQFPAPKTAPLRPRPPIPTGLPRYPEHLSDVPSPLPRRTKMGGGWLVEPNFRSLPLDVGGSAPAYLLSRPAQRSLTLCAYSNQSGQVFRSQSGHPFRSVSGHLYRSDFGQAGVPSQQVCSYRLMMDVFRSRLQCLCAVVHVFHGGDPRGGATRPPTWLAVPHPLGGTCGKRGRALATREVTSTPPHFLVSARSRRQGQFCRSNGRRGRGSHQPLWGRLLFRASA